jgi:gentisate 1,2-dioxygenase
MHEGDFIITPSWTWHDHGNDTDQPMVWLDGLDIPMIRFFDAGFAENGSASQQAVSKISGTSFAAYGHTMMPVRKLGQAHHQYQHTSPIFNYPYSRTREALATLAKNEATDPHHGHMLKYINPVTGRSAMPTIGTAMQLLPAGITTAPSRRTDGTVYSVVEGEVEVKVNFLDHCHTFTAKKRDQFVVPSWHSLSLRAQHEAVLFSFSDLPVQEALGIHRIELL